MNSGVNEARNLLDQIIAEDDFAVKADLYSQLEAISEQFNSDIDGTTPDSNLFKQRNDLIAEGNELIAKRDAAYQIMNNVRNQMVELEELTRAKELSVQIIADMKAGRDILFDTLDEVEVLLDQIKTPADAAALFNLIADIKTSVLTGVTDQNILDAADRISKLAQRALDIFTDDSSGVDPALIIDLFKNSIAAVRAGINADIASAENLKAQIFDQIPLVTLEDALAGWRQFKSLGSKFEAPSSDNQTGGAWYEAVGDLEKEITALKKDRELAYNRLLIAHMLMSKVADTSSSVLIRMLSDSMISDPENYEFEYEVNGLKVKGFGDSLRELGEFASSNGYGIPDTIRGGHKMIAANGKLYILGGWDGHAETLDRVMYSEDGGETWDYLEDSSGSMHLIPEPVRYHAAATGPDGWAYIFGGNYPEGSYTVNAPADPRVGVKVFRTKDFITWEVLENPALDEPQQILPVMMDSGEVIWDASRGLFVLTGGRVREAGGWPGDYNQDVYTSTDGIQWTKSGELPMPTNYHEMVIKDGKYYVIGGSVNNPAHPDNVYSTINNVYMGTPPFENYYINSDHVWVSEDGGVTWTEQGLDVTVDATFVNNQFVVDLTGVPETVKARISKVKVYSNRDGIRYWQEVELTSEDGNIYKSAFGAGNPLDHWQVALIDEDTQGNPKWLYREEFGDGESIKTTV
ncbi:MAG: exo-alpha-sialidase, partial [Candidatus Omnitrophica bacterium]|nr:exo-alpha-sialidase [Candidatus Omnitrophota bacterium]